MVLLSEGMWMPGGQSSSRVSAVPAGGGGVQSRAQSPPTRESRQSMADASATVCESRKLKSVQGQQEGWL